MKQLFYNKPALRWKSALPVGNGFTAAMIYGGRRKEKIAFNDVTLWSGYPKDYDNPESLQSLKAVRSLVFSGKYREATVLAEEKLTGGYSESFLPLGNLEIKLTGGLGQYSRALDLNQAILTIQSGALKRTCFASNPARVLVYQITGQRFQAVLRANSPLKNEVYVQNGLVLCGNAPDYVAPNYLHGERHPVVYRPNGKGMAFALFVRPVTDGQVIEKGNRIVIKGASYLTLISSTATGFLGYDQMPLTDRKQVVQKAMQQVMDAGTDVSKLKKEHIEDYKALFSRQDFSLHTDRSGRTDKLLKDPAAFQAVCELLYHYGKYLMISGSRRGGQPLNLQGQWNANIRPAWSSNYTVNINTQMNYWGASLCGLQECLEPYFRMVHEVCKRGGKTAKVNYGCRGFACNHNVDLWRKTAPVIGESNYMYAPLCGVWLANEIYEHYLNGGLDAERDTVLEIVRQAALFIMDYLVEHDGCYVSCPSASPEAVFDRNGRCALGLHSAFENGLARQALMNAASIVEEPSERTKIQNTLDHLQPFEYAQEGLSEWSGGISCSEKGHRHFSPLYALYPGRVAGAKDPELLFQMRKLFDCRQANSKGQIGWSTAWAICLAGRFHDGATAQKNIQLLIDKALFRNLFNVHWPAIFQIDGNFGYVAGVNECLIGYQDGVIELLPALPPDWREGKMNGAQIRGARISFSWKNGQVTQVSSDREIILSGKNLAKNCRIGELIRLKEGT